MKALILAGGSGTRLWPLSREEKPKQFHALTSPFTLLQETVKRLKFLKWSDIYVATVAPYAKEISRQLPKLPKDHLLIEPTLRDTGPCILMATIQIAKQSSPNEIISIVYSDHLIQNEKEFEKKLLVAEKIVKEEPVIAIIEVKAKFPNPNLGYVKIGKLLREMADGTEVYALDGFVEKPNVETAKKYLLSYRYLWNTGMYTGRAETFISAYKKYAPKIYEAVQKTVSSKKTADSFKYYSACLKTSIDYAIMEKINPTLVRIIPADLDWSDIGNFSALFDELTADRRKNFVLGRHIGIETEGSVIYGNKKKLIATIGVKNLIVVDTGDALLICPKDRAADVKKLVEKLKKIGKIGLL